MNTPYHFLPVDPASSPAQNPTFQGSVDITDGSLCIDGVTVISSDRHGAFDALKIAGDPVAAGPLVPGPFADDATAALAGVSIGQCYRQAVTGFLRARTV